jgi:hypothetical protein
VKSLSRKNFTSNLFFSVYAMMWNELKEKFLLEISQVEIKTILLKFYQKGLRLHQIVKYT